VKSTRKGARKLADVTPELKTALESGELETATLVEGLSIDFPTLLGNVFPELREHAEAAFDAKAGITKRMLKAAEIIYQYKGVAALDVLCEHESDTVRGWAAYLISLTPNLSLKQRLIRIRKLADDSHFGVREWAWLSLRLYIVETPEAAIKLLVPLTKKSSPNLRRFAVESTRPRGVWCSHITILKASPELGMTLLEPLKNDSERYVQDSVANWLNDAGKSQPDWVIELCRRWQKDTDSPAINYIIKRAMRNL